MEGPIAYNFDSLQFRTSIFPRRTPRTLCKNSGVQPEDHWHWRQRSRGVTGAAPPDRMNNNEWCRCGNCRPMQSAIECICCRELRNCQQFFSQSVECITMHPDLSKVCLERAVLRTALVLVKWYW